MLTLYYAPGACSMASHIALEETGVPYEAKPVSLATGEHLKDEYLNNVNPRGKVPALRTDEGVLTENVAIITYLARAFPQAKLLPDDPLPLARALSHMTYLTSAVHPAFTHIMRPGRFATDESAHDNLKATGRENFWNMLQEIDGLLDGKQYVLGSQYSAADGYTLVFYGWGKRIGLPVEQLKNYTALERPAATAPGRAQGARTRAEPAAAELISAIHTQPEISQPRRKPGPTRQPLGTRNDGSRLSPG